VNRVKGLDFNEFLHLDLDLWLPTAATVAVGTQGCMRTARLHVVWSEGSVGVMS